jgi:hypothetical protein
MTIDERYENRVRKLAAKHRCIVSRERNLPLPIDNIFVGGFALRDNRNRLIMGNATLDQIEYYLQGER